MEVCVVEVVDVGVVVDFGYVVVWWLYVYVYEDEVVDLGVEVGDFQVQVVVVELEVFFQYVEIDFLGF